MNTDDRARHHERHDGDISGRSLAPVQPMRQTIRPRDEQHWRALRACDLTSTDIPALFGLSPYKTHFELWHEKHKVEIVELDDNERMKWGRRLESSIALGIAEDRGLVVRPMKEYMRIDGARLGASFDYRILVAGTNSKFRDGYDDPLDSLLEIKNVDWLAFKNGWLIDETGFLEAPAHIELQVQHQLLVSGLKRALIGVMVGGNDIRILEREADEPTQRAILQAARAFWASIDANAPPPPVMPDDAAAVIEMHQFAEPGKLFDARENDRVRELVAEYVSAAHDEKLAAERKEVRKAELLEIIGASEKVLLDGYSVSAGMVGPCDVAYTRKGYRNFRVTVKKPPAPKKTAARREAEFRDNYDAEADQSWGEHEQWDTK